MSASTTAVPQTVDELNISLNVAHIISAFALFWITYVRLASSDTVPSQDNH